jgi:glutathione peroxidase-family protein
LAFPIADFHQELSTDAEIQSFLHERFSINFPVLGVSTLHDNPVYRQLQQHIPDRHVQHNFFKYLVDTNGIAVQLFSKKQDPIDLVDDIEQQLHLVQK